jgi:bifunctional N-acetylglucosamine-1-phosphate-uridyltransferase/glucosamine-1-phosphate-acetyltransferase GlmU-like protein
MEQRDIDAMTGSAARNALDAITEANCPLYALRARTLRRFTRNLLNNNAQRQYYFTDIIENISHRGKEVRSITTCPGEPEYDLLCSDVTRPRDLALLEGVLASGQVVVGPPQGVFNGIDVTIPAPGPATVTVETSEIPAGTTIEVKAKPQVGNMIVVQEVTLNVGNCDGSGNCTEIAVLILDSGAYFIEARATFQTP